MANETLITIVGNLVETPELRYTPSGAAVANFTVASTPRIFREGEWVDGESLFMRCNIWRQAAEHMTASLKRGDRVIVTGRLQQRSYETREGEKRSTMEVLVDEIGASLRYTTVQIVKGKRGRRNEGISGASGSEEPASSVGDDEPPF